MLSQIHSFLEGNEWDSKPQIKLVSFTWTISCISSPNAILTLMHWWMDFPNLTCVFEKGFILVYKKEFLFEFLSLIEVSILHAFFLTYKSARPFYGTSRVFFVVAVFEADSLRYIFSFVKYQKLPIFSSVLALLCARTDAQKYQLF